jgi:hypothetical protein
MASDRAYAHSDSWTAFGVGVLGGVVGGLSLLSFAGILAVALIAIVGGFGLRPRPFGAAGVLLGWATTWVIVLAGAQARCSSPCGTDITPWVAFATGLATIGTGLLVVGIARPAWASEAARVGGRWLTSRSVRIGIAILLGAIAGLYASTLLIFGWATSIPIWLWFAWRHRKQDRRTEIIWLTAAAAVTFVALVPR